MRFSDLISRCGRWKDILVIGRTIERDGEKYHIVGMTLKEMPSDGAEETACLYIIEPYMEDESFGKARRGRRNYKRLLKEQEETKQCYLNCREIYIGNRKLHIFGGNSSPMKYCVKNSAEIQLFADMIKAGWETPDWLKDEEWENLQLVTLDIANLKRLPKYSAEMPIRIKHEPDFERHMLEKPVALTVGKSSILSFTDSLGEKVRCYINNVTLIDVWRDTEEKFNNPEYIKRIPSEEQLLEIKKHAYEALEQSCPKGMCYVGIEYECSRDIILQFYSKEFLKSSPEEHAGSASLLMPMLRPDKKTGMHNLRLRGAVIATPYSPDTERVSAEILFYMERGRDWEEIV